MSNALERLNSSQEEVIPNYSLEEQLNSEDDFLNGMSSDSREALFKSVAPESSITEVVITTPSSDGSEEDTSAQDNPQKPIDVVTSSDDGLFNNKEKQDRKQRGKPKQDGSNSQSNVFDPIMNQIALNLINEMQTKKVKVNDFDDNLMQIVFDYMRTKF